VGITKAVLLMTNGRIGPAFDSTVREKLGADLIATSSDRITLLEHVAERRLFEHLPPSHDIGTIRGV
jgi:hypothetical protein